jgi:hypothetical protein
VTDVEELTAYGVAHAHSQNVPLPVYREVCRRIVSDDDGTPGSWAAEWTAEGDRCHAAGRPLEAAGRYNLARFPFLDSDARRQAQTRALAACAEWAAGQKGLEQLEVPYAGGVLRCWAGGLSTSNPLPVLVVMGGIVTAKEQWVQLLPRLARLGLAGIVAEMPGVGANETTYTADSWRMIPALLDAVAGRARSGEAYAMALSFSGHLALRAAAHDPRLRGIVTVGAPVARLFTEGVPGLPAITAATLAHLTGVEPAKLAEHLADGWAIPPGELSALDIPVRYVSSLRDEVIPPGEAALLRETVRDLKILEHDDEHAAPRYAAETRLWVLRQIAVTTGAPALPRAALAGAWHLLRARRLLARRRAR